MTNYQIMEDMLIKFLKQFAKKPITPTTDNKPVDFVSNWHDDQGAIGALHILCTMNSETYNDQDIMRFMSAGPQENNQVMKEVYFKILEIGQLLPIVIKQQALNIDRLIYLQRLLCKISINLINENFIECHAYNGTNHYEWGYHYSSIHAKRMRWELHYPDDDRDTDGIPYWMKDYLIVCETVANRRTIMADKNRPKESNPMWRYDDQRRVAIIEKEMPKDEGPTLNVETIMNIVKEAYQKEDTDGKMRGYIRRALKHTNISTVTYEEIREMRNQLTQMTRYGIDGKSGTMRFVQTCDEILFGMELILSNK